jgi:hypothetical protein
MSSWAYRLAVQLKERLDGNDIATCIYKVMATAYKACMFRVYDCDDIEDGCSELLISS